MTKYVATKYSVCVSLAMTNAYYTKNVSLVTSISVVDIGISLNISYENRLLLIPF